MRALSNRAAARCETGKNKRCRCRCGGLLHGIKRAVDPNRQFFESLPEDDPHHVRGKEEKKRRAKLKREEVAAAAREMGPADQQGWLWDPGETT